MKSGEKMGRIMKNNYPIDRLKGYWLRQISHLLETVPNMSRNKEAPHQVIRQGW